MTVRRKHSNKIVTLRMTEWQSDTKHRNKIVTLCNNDTHNNDSQT
jgi:hypothetical protein